MIFELSENQKDILSFLIKETESEEAEVLMECMKAYSHCSLEGDEWTLIEEDIILLMHLFEALNKDEIMELIKNAKRKN